MNIALVSIYDKYAFKLHNAIFLYDIMVNNRSRTHSNPLMTRKLQPNL